MANKDIRNYAHSHKVKLWHIADELKITDSSLSRKLRYELSDEEKQRIFKIIDTLAK